MATDFQEELQNLGLTMFGRFEIAPDNCPPDQMHLVGRTGVLIGNGGANMWRVFADSIEFRDGSPHPLDRWSRSNLEKLASQFQAEAIFPFGLSLWPFQKFAKQAMGLEASPMGLLIHPTFGLWHAYRGAILFDEVPDFLQDHFGDGHVRLANPCMTCAEKPCLNTCPVGAISADGLNIGACDSHLKANAAPNCSHEGCAARNACPIGQQYQYTAPQLAFHMAAFNRRKVS